MALYAMGTTKKARKASARWFQSLSLEERMDLFRSLTGLILENNHRVVEKKDADPASKRIRITTIP